MKEINSDKIPVSNKIRDIKLSQYHSGNTDGIIDFIFDTLPTGVLILNRKTEIVYGNKQASLFLSRFNIPEEIPSVGRRIFDAIDRDKFQELFPGEIIIVKKFEGSPSNWLFRLAIPVKSQPIIITYIIEDKISNKLDVNEIRRQYRLTRREADIVRRLLDGLKNVEISKEFEIMKQTVKDHLSNIYHKMGVENRFDLMRSLVSPSNIQAHI
jgi:DNA-binding CsgD family transcriptional regulator